MGWRADVGVQTLQRVLQAFAQQKLEGLRMGALGTSCVGGCIAAGQRRPQGLPLVGTAVDGCLNGFVPLCRCAGGGVAAPAPAKVRYDQVFQQQLTR